MTEVLYVTAPPAPIRVSIRPPTSKSISNRVLIMAALEGSRHVLHQLSDAGDTRRLDHLVNERPGHMDCGAGGTTFRFLLAFAAGLAGEEHLLTGTPRLLERPHGPLIEALRTLGADIKERTDGLVVRGKRLAGGSVELRSPMSSQYVTALLLVAPYMKNGLRITWSGHRLSVPYVEMTIRLMRQFGAEVDVDEATIAVRPGRYTCTNFVVPGDRSAASFWYEIAALSADARITLLGMHDDGSQGDAIATKLWDRWVISEETGDGTVLRTRENAEMPAKLEFDLRDAPDLFQPLLFTCAAKGVTAEFLGLENLPLKESDRTRVCAEVLARLGGSADLADGRFLLHPWQLIPASATDVPVIDPQHDHRMAMAVAPLALLIGGIRIADPRVVEKSYPLFWDHLRNAGFGVEPIGS